MRRHPSPLAAHSFLLLVLLFAGPARAEYYGGDPIEIPLDKYDAGTLALDGDFVHNVGELHLNITNWGLIGSRPGTSTNYSEAPSAMWPAGSGVEHLWAAGVWIGAIKGGVPLVTTGQFTPELMALPDDPLDTVWETKKGMDGGERYPSPDFDDDGDGEGDEDPLNGIDDDGDGLIDEDFAVAGNQGFSLSMRDNSSLLVQLWPEHEPLGIQLDQTSYQWEGDDFDDFVGFDFKLTNIGNESLTDVFFGFFADCDIGRRENGSGSLDDLPGYFEGRVRADDGTWVPLTIAYMYDADGDDGVSPGFFGITYLDSPTDYDGVVAPQLVGASAFHAFAGTRSFERGGDPTNDYERYELLSSGTIDSVPGLYATDFANDYRILVSAGPFVELEPGETMNFAAAMVVGPGLWGLLQHGADAGLTYYGAWFNRDGDYASGVGRTEKLICATDFGSTAGNPQNPIYSMFVSPCDTIGGALVFPIKSTDLDKNGCIWVNSDCRFELSRGAVTGVGGREHWVPWLRDTAPVSPDMRVWESDQRTHLFWNNMSELVRDELTLLNDFESYRIWRADGWERPFGTSIENGPPSSLWRLVAEFDLVNSYETKRVVDKEEVIEELPLGANTGLDMVRYTPAMLIEGTQEYEEVADARDLVARILEDPVFDYLGPTKDPADFLRYAIRSGRLTPVGERYPEISRYSNSWDVIDTLYWGATGLEFYEYVDENVFNGFAYFYAVTATSHETRAGGAVITGFGIESDPQGNFEFATPRFGAQTAESREEDGQNIFVFPNPATPASLSEFSQFSANSDDPTGVRVMFANLPASRNTISIFTLAGDLVEVIEHDGTTADCPETMGFGNCGGSAYWNLVSRQGQEVVSGIYLYSVESSDPAFDRVVGRFVIVR